MVVERSLLVLLYKSQREREPIDQNGEAGGYGCRDESCGYCDRGWVVGVVDSGVDLLS